MSSVERVRQKRAEGRASPGDFSLLLEALAELQADHLRPALREAGDIEVDIEVEGHPGVHHIQIRGGHLLTDPGPLGRCTRVVLSPEAAANMVAHHSGGVLFHAFTTGGLRVQGDPAPLMALIPILDAAHPHLGGGSLFEF
ncbi:MAG: hypothetical protein HY558_05460 [Euryarchaeota archaeon]|nr:hypothetical protein [Euryarchaeota archaeon]